MNANQPLVVCDGWTEPRHPRVILKDGDASKVSHSICAECSDAMDDAHMWDDIVCDFCGGSILVTDTFACPRCGWKVA